MEGLTTIHDTLYTDDLALVAEQRQDLLTVIDVVCTKWGMTISTEKSKVLAAWCEDVDATIWLNMSTTT